jgi:Predicted transcriptional regulators
MIDGLSVVDLIESGIYKQISTKEYFNRKTKTIESRSETIGKIITQCRLSAGYTQSEIARAIGIAQTTYAGYETGRHEPNIEILIRLSDIYKASLDVITGRYIDRDEVLIEEYTRQRGSENLEQNEAEHVKLIQHYEREKDIKTEAKKRGTYNRAKRKKP